MWTYLTNVFSLNDLHKGEIVKVKIEGEILHIYPGNSQGYKTGTCTKIFKEAKGDGFQ